jgi:hypothetical protein
MSCAFFLFCVQLCAAAPAFDTGSDLEYLASLMPAGRYQEFIYYDIQAVRRETAADASLAAFLATRGELDPGSIIEELPGFRADEIANLLIAIGTERCSLRVAPLAEKAESPNLEKGSSFIFSTSEIVLTLDDRRVTGSVEGEFLAVVTLLDPTRIAKRLAADTTLLPPHPQFRKRRVFRMGGADGDPDDAQAWFCAWSPDTILAAGSRELLVRMIAAGDGLADSLADSIDFRNLMNHRGDLGQCVDYQNPQSPYLAVLDAAEQRETLRGQHLDRLRAEFEERAGAYLIKTLRFGTEPVEERIELFADEEEAMARERQRRAQLAEAADIGNTSQARKLRLQRAATTLTRDGALLRETFTPGPEYLRLFAPKPTPERLP